MNRRPSTQILVLPEAAGGERSSRSLRWRLPSVAGIGALVVLGAGAYVGLAMLHRSMAADVDARIVNAASLSSHLVDRVLAERARQVELIASSPSVIAAASKGGDESRQRGLQKLSIAQLEELFKATRSQQVDESTRAYLNDLLPRLDVAEVMVTDQYGFNAVTTSPSFDFVQSDEGWWQTAWATGLTTAQATADAATQRTVVELASVIRDRAGAKVGVVKVKFGLSTVDTALAQGDSGTPLRVDLVDSAGKVIASSASKTRFKAFGAFAVAASHPAGLAFDYSVDAAAHRGAVSLTNDGRWRVIAHMSAQDAGRAYGVARTSLLAGVLATLLLIVGSLMLAARFIERRITGPAEALAVAAEAVAAGDLTKQVDQIGSDDEIGRLARAVAAMIAELRRLARALNESATETSSMTAEINASSEEMAASAGQIAHTAADLSQQANVMAETIQALAVSSQHLVNVASDLDTGARDGVARNAQLRALALENRARLDASSQSLTTLTVDVEASARAIEQLAQASEEVRSFVALVQKLARQSKLLALNAAMEAARAGEHGHGFAVVADEVRRLAAMSSDAAEKTERVVSSVLQGIAASRNSTERTVDTVRSVRGATEQGSRSFGEIEKAVVNADDWTSSIQQTVTVASGVAREMRARLDSLAGGTESFAAAMEEVAASSEQQSASTEQIAAAAGHLASAAERLGELVANLRTDEYRVSQPAEPERPPVSARPPRALGFQRSVAGAANA